MSFDPHANFSYSTILTAPTPAASGTSIVIQAGDGAKFPAASFNATIWPAGQQPTTANAEIVRVTVIAVDTFTITRTQEGTPARTIVAGDQIAATITKKTIADIEAAIPTILTVPSGGTGVATLAIHGVLIGNGAGVVTVSAVGTTGQVLTGVTGADPVWAAPPSQLTLLKAGSGADTNAAATNVDTIAITGLTAKDRLIVEANFTESTQVIGRIDLYSTTDAGAVVALTNALGLNAGTKFSTSARIAQGQAGSTTYDGLANGVQDNGGGPAALVNITQFAAATAWTGAWTLALRHNGITAGGTLHWSWSVYKLAGQ